MHCILDCLSVLPSVSLLVCLYMWSACSLSSTILPDVETISSMFSGQSFFSLETLFSFVFEGFDNFICEKKPFLCAV